MKKLGEIKPITILNISEAEARKIKEAIDKLLPIKCECRKEGGIDFQTMFNVKKLFKERNLEELTLKKICDYCFRYKICPWKEK